MTPLRQRFIEDLQLRNRSPRTIECYVFHVRQFAVHFKRSPDQLTLEHAHRYLVYLLKEKKASWAHYNQAVCALRFFYQVTCPREDALVRLPYGKRPRCLATVRTREEVARFLAAVTDRKIRMLLRTIYATGLRLSEALHLKPANIDRHRLLVKVMGKGQKERLIPLSPTLLAELRDYWRQERPRQWLFPGLTHERPLNPTAVQRNCQRTCRKAGLRRITPHTLRHCYATHLFESGIDLRMIQALLGHHRVTTTAGYTHATTAGMERVVSPLDMLPQLPTITPAPPAPNAPPAAPKPPPSQP
jgi:integrase/recombinase XerD